SASGASARPVRRRRRAAAQRVAARTPPAGGLAARRPRSAAPRSTPRLRRRRSRASASPRHGSCGPGRSAAGRRPWRGRLDGAPAMWKKPVVPPALAPHPKTRPGAVQRVDVSVSRDRNGTLALAFALEGRLADLRIPPAGEPRRGHELWRHTCFEAFIARDGTTEYHELNLAPSREGAVYAFRAYRDGGPLDDETLAPRVAVPRGAERRRG